MKRKPKQKEFIFSHGGKREGAGRPKKKDAIVHAARPAFSRHHPLHITLRVAEGLPSLRRKDLFQDFKDALRKARGLGFNVIHFSLLSNHVHLLVESSNKKDLERVMKSLLLSFTLKLKRKGFKRIFERRYHLHVLKTPRETRQALRYVLLNEEKHRGLKLAELRSLRFSPFQTNYAFQGWRELLEKEFRPLCATNISLEVACTRQLLASPKTWLLREGWKRHVQARGRATSSSRGSV